MAQAREVFMARHEEVETDERRTTPRHDVAVEVTFESEHNFYTAETRDLSLGGLFLATDVLRPVGECVRVHFTLPGSTEVLDAITEVRWLRTSNVNGDNCGMGLQFLQMSPKTKKAVQEFAAKREMMIFDDEER
jgi:uncharacterized protein (TIGR02266 family)